MSSRWDEAVKSVNAYVEELAKANAGCKVTLAAFDRLEKTEFDILRDSVPISDWKPLVNTEVEPRGNTPLLDAVMRLLGLAKKSNSERSAFIIMTDGQENASTEVTKKDVQKALAQVTKKGWQTVFLGVEFDAFADKAGVGGTGISSAYVAGTTRASAVQALSSITANTVQYFSTGVSSTDRIRQYGSK